MSIAEEYQARGEAKGIKIGEARGEARGIEIGKSEGIEIGEARGESRGIQIGESNTLEKATLVFKLHKLDKDISFIQQETGLSIDAIKKLLASLH